MTQNEAQNHLRELHHLEDVEKVNRYIMGIIDKSDLDALDRAMAYDKISNWTSACYYTLKECEPLIKNIANDNTATE